VKLLEKLKSISSYKTIVIISIFILLITGIVPSWLLSEWTWFARSGALLVVFGISIVWLDYKGSINKDLDTVFAGFQDYLNDKDKDISKKEITSTEKIILGKFNEVSELTNKRFQNIEFFILATGTLIWGYGDLINKIDFKPSSSIEQVKQIEANKTIEHNKTE
jgi:hypothetical protein